MNKIIPIFICLILTSTTVLSQIGKNYPSFDHKKVHFGFALGVNTSDFHYSIGLDSTNNIDSITGITIKKQPGFNLGIVSSWDIHETFHIRFIPSLSFQERVFIYRYSYKGVQKKLIKIWVHLGDGDDKTAAICNAMAE